MKKILIIMLCLIPLVFLASCNDSEIESTETLVGTVVDSAGNEREIKGIECSAKANENITNQYTSFKDDEYNYYVFYVGRLYNVALESGSRDYYHGFEEKELNFVVSEVTTNMVKSTASQVVVNSSHQDFSVSESFKYSKGSSASAGIALNYISASVGMSKSIEVGLSATQAWGFSQSETISKSYEDCVTKSKEEETSLKIKFNSNYPVGYYLYTMIGDLDVYNVVVVDRDSAEFEVYTFSSIVTSNRQLLYIGEELEYSNEPSNPLEFDLSKVEDCLLKEPTTDISEQNGNVIAVTMARYNCNDGNNYNKNEQEESADWRSRHNGYEIGQLNLYGCKGSGNQYSIVDHEQFAIRYQVLKDVDDLPKVKTSSTKLADDSATSVKGTNIDGKVGYGAYWVRVTYTDDSQECFNKTNVLKNATEGTMVTLLTSDNIADGKSIKSIDVVFVYEIYAGGPGFLGIWWHEHSNWRCEYTYSFIG